MRSRLAALSAMGAMLVCLSARGADELLKHVPQSALGFVAINNLAQTDGKLQALGMQVGLPLPSPLMLVKAQIGVREGIDDNRSAALVVFPGADADAAPRPAILIPVTDYGKFIAQLKAEDATGAITTIEAFGNKSLARQAGDYAVLVENSGRELLEKEFAPGAALAELTDWPAWIGDQDLAAVVTRNGVKLLAELAHHGLALLKETMTSQMSQLSEQQSKQLVAGLDLYDKLIALMDHDVATLGLGLHRGDDGTLRLAKRFALLPDSGVTKWLAKTTVTPVDFTKQLPQMPYMLAGSGSFSPQARDAVIGWSLAMMRASAEMYQVTPEQLDFIERQSRKLIAKFEGAGMMLGVVPPEKPLYAGLVGVMKTADAAEMVREYQAYLKRYNEMFKDSKGMLRPIAIEEFSIDGAPALEMSMDYTQMVAASGGNAEQSRAVMEKMFGPGGTVKSYLAAAGKEYVVFAYIDKSLVERSVRLIAKGAGPKLGDDERLAATRRLLPPQAPVTAYVSVPGVLEFIRAMAAGVGQAPAPIPDFPATPPLGFALTTAPRVVEVQMVIPAEVIKAGAELAQKLRGR